MAEPAATAESSGAVNALQSASLADLHDLALPPEPGFWPPAEGFWVLVLLLAVAGLTVWRLRRRKAAANAYRHAGLAALAEADTVYQLSQVLKRVALVVWPREQVAGLHGQEWCDFLNRSCPGCDFGEALWRRPEAGLADDASPQIKQDGAQLRQQAAVWIRRHRREVG